MADACDIATDYTERELARHLEAQRARARLATAGEHSAMECVDCGEPIPKARRTALPGCQRCVPCAEIEESRSSLSASR
ncbi:phage/conjugal plasmid C-4 type zinc finger TraR family protein [Natronocella acetinitrilica]|uniref:Phage/conjugal plasmid C-4 type zinc finger TraR family protein n=1 Tax=Natronocella acetinitrilica TaxID=414046 RepID=A0AAE3G4H1_9GAMM|nr:TraR/DksA C4-type zinc finger protein [Natronocella acetinitrilica]MCP1675474.1 phage/conjugal plasmid C-4 type zinc finger TraR family protein [Natronocella acetinitrilica]